MAKPNKYAPLLCTIFMVIAIIGIVLGFVFKQALIPIILLLPTAIYEVIEQKVNPLKRLLSFCWRFWSLMFLVLFDVQINITEILGSDQQYIGGYWVPLGDLRIVATTVITIISVILFTRTRGCIPDGWLYFL